MDRVTRALPFEDRNGRFSFRTMFSYLFDYGIIIALAVVYAALDKLVTPFAQPFSLQDIRLQYPYAEHERIPIMNAVLISGAFPLVAIAIYTLVVDGIFSHSSQTGFRRYTFKQRLWELNCGVLGLLLAQGAAFCITGTLKNLVGRPRPDVISRCRPSEPIDLAPFTLATKLICTQENAAIMQDAFRSFPSGHSSSSFAGLGYLSLYFSGKLHILDQRGEVWRTVIVIIPLLAAACIAASRIMDARHHPTDVFIGSALGLLCAWAAYRQYFPALSDVARKGRAYKMREWGISMTRRPTDRNDEDQTGYYASGYSGANPQAGTSTVLPRHLHGGSGDQGPEMPLYPKHPTATVIDEENQLSYQMQPMSSSAAARAAALRTDLPPIPPQHGGNPHVPPVYSQSSQSEDADYEVVRPKTSHTSPTSQYGPRGSFGSQNPNVFRDQISRNMNQRGPSGSQQQQQQQQQPSSPQGVTRRQVAPSDEDDGYVGEDMGDRTRKPLIEMGKPI